jgi:hypothetical protein
VGESKLLADLEPSRNRRIPFLFRLCFASTRNAVRREILADPGPRDQIVVPNQRSNAATRVIKMTIGWVEHGVVEVSRLNRVNL